MKGVRKQGSFALTQSLPLTSDATFSRHLTVETHCSMQGPIFLTQTHPPVLDKLAASIVYVSLRLRVCTQARRALSPEEAILQIHSRHIALKTTLFLRLSRPLDCCLVRKPEDM